LSFEPGKRLAMKLAMLAEGFVGEDGLVW
jgi:hypothetical protein